jgi:IclR family transcriptional regulator, positive regulator for flagellar biogenesis
MSAYPRRAEAAALLTVSRGMQVLRAFKSDRASLTNSELVRRTGLSKAAVSRLTSTLLQLGYLRHVPGGREFELAAGALGVGSAYLATSELLATADPFLQELADRLNMSVALAVGDGLEMLYIGYRASRRTATLRLGIGSVLPMGTTSIGRAYLWALPALKQIPLIAQLRQNVGSEAVALERGIRESFKELDATGTCAVLDGFQHHAYGIALPVIVGRQQVTMALSCGKAEMQIDLAAERGRVAPYLKQAAVHLHELLADFDGHP